MLSTVAAQKEALLGKWGLPWLQIGCGVSANDAGSWALAAWDPIGMPVGRAL